MKHPRIVAIIILVACCSMAAMAVTDASNPPIPTITHSISISGNGHGPQVLTAGYQQADKIVTTSNPQFQGNEGQFLQPSVNPQR